MKTQPQICARFGATVRRLREDAGLSQEDLAELADVHRTYIGGIERGERNPTLTTIEKLAAALKCSPNELLVEAEKS